MNWNNLSDYNEVLFILQNNVLQNHSVNACLAMKLKMNWHLIWLTMSVYLIFFLKCSIITVQVSLSSLVSLQGKHQRRLYRDLMTDYNPLERPVFNDSQSLTVHFGFSLMQIMDVVRKESRYTAKDGNIIAHTCLGGNQQSKLKK